jgi:hypothetical protein
VRPGDIAKVTQCDEVFGIERERGLEDAPCLIVPARLEERLAVHDVPTHVPGLLGQELLTDENGLLEIADFAVFIGERREIPARILVEFLPELVDTRRTGH